ERGQDRGGALRFLHALGDARAQARHLDPFLRARAGGTAGHVTHDVTLGDASATAGAFDLAGIEIVFSHHPARRRRQVLFGILRLTGSLLLFAVVTLVSLAVFVPALVFRVRLFGVLIRRFARCLAFFHLAQQLALGD